MSTLYHSSTLDNWCSITVYEPGAEEDRARWRWSIGPWRVLSVLGVLSVLLVAGGFVATLYLLGRAIADGTQWGLFACGVLSVDLAFMIWLEKTKGPQPGAITVAGNRPGPGDDAVLLWRAARAAEAAGRAAGKLGGRDQDELAVQVGMLPMAVWRLAEAVDQSTAGAVTADLVPRVEAVERLAETVEALAVDRTPLDAVDAILDTDKENGDG